MVQSTNLLLSLMEAAVDQKYLIFNETAKLLDALVQLAVKDRDLATPPGSPSDGDRYIVASGGTGAWSTWDLNIAVYIDGAWRKLVPREGWQVWVEDEDVRLVYQSGSWVNVETLTRALSAQHSGDTNNSSSGSGSDYTHNKQYIIPANYLTAGKMLRVTVGYEITTGSAAPVLVHRLKAGATTLADHANVTPNNNISNHQYALQYLIIGTAAPGASVAVEIVPLSIPTAALADTQRSAVNSPVNLATNGSLTLTANTNWATAGTGTNTIRQSFFLVEALN